MEKTKVLLERTAFTASLSALRVGASLIEPRARTFALLFAAPEAQLWLGDLHLRLWDETRNVEVIVPDFHALLLVGLTQSQK